MQDVVKVKDIMTEKLVTIEPDEPIIQAIKAMDEGGLRRLPVLKAGHLIGIITDRDIRKALNSPMVFHEKTYADYLLREIRVGSCMTREPLTVSPQADIVDAAALMEQEKIGRLPVMNGNRLVGIITVSDLVDYLILILKEAEA
jgi:acetoin utilization protein AcuB